MRKKSTAKTKKKWSWGYAGYYKKFWCDSSWELAFLMYHLDNKIEIKRNNRGFSYTYYNKKHKFYPDFIISGCYYEIKGKMDRKSQSKIKQFKSALVVVGKEDIAPYLKHAVDNYGIEFYKLLKDKK